MMGKRRGAEPVDSRVLAAHEDARRLAMEIAGMEPAVSVDPVGMRVVLESDETAWRQLDDLWLRVMVDGAWSEAAPARALLTSRRLLVRLRTGEVLSLWWGSLAGFDPDIGHRHVVFDYGDGTPRAVSGADTALVAVAGIASLYGIKELTSHPALSPLRRMSPSVS